MDAEKSKKTKLADDAAHGASVLQRQQNDEWCDVQLFGKDSDTVQGIKAHKSILAAASPHFREAFKSKGFLDSGTNKYHTPQIDHETLQIIVDFIYQSSLRIADEDLCARLKLVLINADFLLMSDLVNVCGKSLDDPKYLKTKCATNTWLFARKYHCPILETAAVCFIASNLCDVAKQNDYLNLSGSDVVSLLKSLTLASPDSACLAATAWLGFREVERKAHCDEVMRQIPLKSMSPDALRRLSEMKFLSEHVLWAVQQLQGMWVVVNKMHGENSSLSSSLNDRNRYLADEKSLSENRRVHLNKMHDQAEKLDRFAKQNLVPTALKKCDAWFFDGEMERWKERRATLDFRQKP